MIKSNFFPVEETDGHSSYIRLRVFLNTFPRDIDIRLLFNEAGSWVKDCKTGKYFNKPINIISFNPYMQYSKPIFEIDFDIMNESPEIINTLMDRLAKVEFTDIKILRVCVGYYNII